MTIINLLLLYERHVLFYMLQFISILFFMLCSLVTMDLVIDLTADSDSDHEYPDEIHDNSVAETLSDDLEKLTE